jgi:hypothetical protein
MVSVLSRRPAYRTTRSMMQIYTMNIRIVCLLALFVSMGCAKRGANGNTPESPAEVSQRVADLAAQGDSAGIAAMLHRTCDESAKRNACIESQLVPLAEQGKVKIAMGALGELAELDPDVRNDGHVFAHGIGIAAGKTTSDVAGAFSQCSESFQSGCYHGVIQAWFGKHDTITAADANALCAPYREDESQRWIRFQCVHGMGHGLTMLYKHDLKQGLEGCDLLTDEWDRHSCYGGAFMENIVNVTNPHHPASALAHGDHGSGDASSEHAGHDMGETKAAAPPFKAVDPNDQQYPCSALSAKYQSSCYGMQTSVMLHNNGGDMAAAAKSCGEAPRNMRSICYASLGRDISSYSRQDHNEAIRMCSVARDVYQPWCYLGVVKNLIDLNARPADGMAFCKSISGESNKQLCYAAVGEQILVLEPDVEKRRVLCGSSELAYRAACLYGASVNRELPPRLEQVYRSIENVS